MSHGYFWTTANMLIRKPANNKPTGGTTNKKTGDTTIKQGQTKDIIKKIMQKVDWKGMEKKMIMMKHWENG